MYIFIITTTKKSEMLRCQNTANRVSLCDS